MVRANALLLSVAAQFNDPTAVEIMKWLNDTTIISGSNDEKYGIQQLSNWMISK